MGQFLLFCIVSHLLQLKFKIFIGFILFLNRPYSGPPSFSALLVAFLCARASCSRYFVALLGRTRWSNSKLIFYLQSFCLLLYLLIKPFLFSLTAQRLRGLARAHWLTWFLSRFLIGARLLLSFHQV